MRKLVGTAIVISLLMSLAVCAMAVTWTYVGKSGYTTTPSSFNDANRIKFGSIAVDTAGKIYFTANNYENWTYSYDAGNTKTLTTTNLGGVSIIATNGTVTDVNVANTQDSSSFNLCGAITKLVVAKNGKVYGLMNWKEINWDFGRQQQRVIKIDSNGTVTNMWSPGDVKTWNTATSVWDYTNNAIQGLTVGQDGNLYWTTHGSDNYWKWHWLWKLDVVAGTASESPMNFQTINNGWSENHRAFDIEWAGGDNFAVMHGGSGLWRADPIQWTLAREYFSQNSTNPGAGRDHVTASAWDKKNKKLWVFGRGLSDTCIATRWNGTVSNASLFNALKQVTSKDNFHINTNAPWPSWGTGPTNGAKYWVSAAALNPKDSKCWVSFSSDTGYTFDTLGTVWSVAKDAVQPITRTSEGVPQAAHTNSTKAAHASRVLSMTFDSGYAYALVVDMVDGDFNVFKAWVGLDTPETGSITEIKAKAPGTYVVTDDFKVTTYPGEFGGGTYFYIEEFDKDAKKCCGIKVVPLKSSDVPVLGTKVKVTGTVDTVDGEAVITGATLTSSGSGSVDAIAMNVRNIGGGERGDQPALDSAFGAPNVSLLIRSAGLVKKYVSNDKTGARWFTIDDGSGASTWYQKTDNSWTSVAGVKVALDFSVTEDSTFAIVTGISSTERVYKNGTTLITQKVIRPRSEDDVQDVTP